MIEISAKLVYALRETTGAPMMKCKAALTATGGDLVRAESVLREQGVRSTAVDRIGNQGFIAVYIHPGNQTVGLVELACATDFVSHSTEFRSVANELAMQVAASAPIAISIDDLPDSFRENAEQALLTQAYIRDSRVKVGSLIDDLKLKVREGVYVRRIARWKVGEIL